ncbi:histone-lysine N-methyltransferase SETD1A-like, partial [Pollicipes pollicipes]|uniref:histone-lysine N-methyltransferase SETD1A-like n=1 Tax=Pollicipes pollicipes TaxID=41117 RepID=UPI001884A2DC
MTSIPDLTGRPAFKLDMICQKLQQDTGAESSELGIASSGEPAGNGHGGSEPDEEPPPAEDEEADEDEEEDERTESRPGESDSDTLDWRDGGDDASCPWSASVGPPAGRPPAADSARRNKRKNFEPRAIVYQYAAPSGGAPRDSADSAGSESDEQALDLTDARPAAEAAAPMDLTVRTPTQINSALPRRPAAVDPSEMKRYAENTMRELLGIYGFPESSETHPGPGKLLEQLTGRLPPAPAPGRT